MSHYQQIQPASIEWQDNTPSSTDHDDIYFSRDSGIDETHYVFLKGNQLPQRWQNKDTFTIAETGFGTGLNFLCTVLAWQKTASSQARLHYISVEKHPLKPADLKRAIEQWPELKSISNELLKHYPPAVHGIHTRQLFDGRVTLTLLFGDASNMFEDLNAHVDAWYLDGFAPSKNPEMWTEALFKQIARLTKPNGTFATFTAAGAIRRSLQAAGFNVEKRPGFGRKREMLVGTLTKPPATTNQQPWFQYPEIKPRSKKAVVIGGGLAGCTTAHSLAQRGWQITLIERHADIAQEASGNHAGVVMPRLTADMSADGRFYLSAFLHTIHWLNQLKQRDPSLPWFQSGVLQLCDEKQQQRMQKLGLPAEVLEICDTASATERCGVSTKSGGLFFPGGGWLEPPALCNWLLEDQRDNITTLLNQSALSLEWKDDEWQIIAETGVIASAESIIIANGHDAERLLDTDTLKLQKVRGQLAHLSANPQSQTLKTPVCYDGYITPDHKGRHCVGASYDIDDDNTALNTESENEILSALTKALPKFTEPNSTIGRVAFRTSTQDHLPLIGPVPNISFYNSNYADLHHGKLASRYPAAQYLPGLYLSSGHGSRGLISCPYSADVITAMLNNDPLPLPQDLLIGTHASRFLIRQLKRGDPLTNP